MVHVEANNNTSNTRTFKNNKKITDIIKSKLPNCKYTISNVIMRKDKPGIERKVIESNKCKKQFKQSRI